MISLRTKVGICGLLSMVLLGCATIPKSQVLEQAHTQVELVSDVSAVTPDQSFWVAIHMKMDPHWHVYWQNPGDSGLAPKIKWILPDGFKAGALQWPYPKVIRSEDLVTYGYEGEVLLLNRIKPPHAIDQNTVQFQAEVTWLACEVPCITGKGTVSLTLPVSKERIVPHPEWEKKFNETKAKLPIKLPDGSVVAWEDSDRIKLVVYPQTITPDRIQSVEFFPLVDDLIEHSAPQKFERILGNKSFSLSLKRNARSANQTVKKVEGVLVVHSSQRTQAWVFSTSLEKAPVSIPMKPLVAKSPVVTASLLGMLIFSFIGGILLNLMPCVFPVLSIKALTIVKHNRSRAMLTRSVFGYTVGVVGTFLLFAVLIILLREAGQSVGWGFQFQSPYFVGGMAIFLFLLALNLLGFFEWPSLGGLSFNQKKDDPLLEAFASGILATIVATPCTAPFMGTAMSFALTQNANVNLLIFMFLGLGMAFPLILLCLFPPLVKKLPKPGPWMTTFKKIMALPLLATVVWLLWVVAGQIQTTKAEPVAPTTLQHPQSTLEWVPYHPNAVQQALKDGKIVFIDFTARWCLTCQVNKKLAFNSDVIRLFKEKGVVAFKADWTNYDETITAGLAQYGKNSVPFNIFLYRENGQETQKALPEILTPAIVSEALKSIP